MVKQCKELVTMHVANSRQIPGLQGVPVVVFEHPVNVLLFNWMVNLSTKISQMALISTRQAANVEGNIIFGKSNFMVTCET